MLIFTLVALVIVLLPVYLHLGKLYALSDADRLIRETHRLVVSQYPHETTPGHLRHVMRLQDADLQRQFFKTIALWPYYWAHQRAVFDLQTRHERHPLRARQRAQLAELEADAAQRALEGDTK